MIGRVTLRSSNRFLRVFRAREIWVHMPWLILAAGYPQGPCFVKGCDGKGYQTTIGFGPGTNRDPSSFTISPFLCDTHAERAHKESATVSNRNIKSAFHSLRKGPREAWYQLTEGWTRV